MAIFNFAQFAARADAHIRTYGSAATLRRASGDRACAALLANYTVAERRANGLIQYNDQHAFVSTTGLTVAPDNEEDKLVVDGVTYDMVAPARPVPNAVNIIYWDLHVRR